MPDPTEGGQIRRPVQQGPSKAPAKGQQTPAPTQSTEAPQSNAQAPSSDAQEQSGPNIDAASEESFGMGFSSFVQMPTSMSEMASDAMGVVQGAVQTADELDQQYNPMRWAQDAAVEAATPMANAAVDMGVDAANQVGDAVGQGVEVARELHSYTPEGVLMDVASGAMQYAMMTPEQRHEQLMAATADIPGMDIIYEQFARVAAYNSEIPAPTLATWGFKPGPAISVMNGEMTGMYMVAFEPLADDKLVPLPEEAKLSEEEQFTPAERSEKLREQLGGDRAPVLAFRGSKDAIDWADDLTSEYVGAYQFATNEADIRAAMSLVGGLGDGSVDTTGHSLGGALAQLAASVGSVRRIVTFQSPGIPAAMIAEIQGQEDGGPEVSHYRAKNDGVAWAGEGHLEGDIHTMDREGFDSPITAHTAFLLDPVNTLREGDANHVEMGEGTSQGETPTQLESVTTGGGPDWNGDSQTDWYEGAYADGRQTGAEVGRRGLGMGAHGVDQGLTAADGVADSTQDFDENHPYLSGGLQALSPLLYGAAQGSADLWEAGRGEDPGSATELIGSLQGPLTAAGLAWDERLDPQMMPLYVTTWEEVKDARDGGANRDALDDMLLASGLDRLHISQMGTQLDGLEREDSDE